MGKTDDKHSQTSPSYCPRPGWEPRWWWGWTRNPTHASLLPRTLPQATGLIPGEQQAPSFCLPCLEAETLAPTDQFPSPKFAQLDDITLCLPGRCPGELEGDDMAVLVWRACWTAVFWLCWRGRSSPPQGCLAEIPMKHPTPTYYYLPGARHGSGTLPSTFPHWEGGGDGRRLELGGQCRKPFQAG